MRLIKVCDRVQETQKVSGIVAQTRRDIKKTRYKSYTLSKEHLDSLGIEAVESWTGGKIFEVNFKMSK